MNSCAVTAHCESAPTENEHATMRFGLACADRLNADQRPLGTYLHAWLFGQHLFEEEQAYFWFGVRSAKAISGLLRIGAVRFSIMPAQHGASNRGKSRSIPRTCENRDATSTGTQPCRRDPRSARPAAPGPHRSPPPTPRRCPRGCHHRPARRSSNSGPQHSRWRHRSAENQERREKPPEHGSFCFPIFKVKGGNPILA